MTKVDPIAVIDQALAALDTPRAPAQLPVVEHALRAAPGEFRLWHVHGLILRQMDRRELALPSLERAAALAPASVPVAHAFARTLFEAGLDSSEAYGAALRLAPGDPAIMLGLASALVAKGQSEAAIGGLTSILRRSPQWVEGHALLSRLRWSIGERAGFADNFDRALAEVPNDIALRRGHLLALLHAEQWDAMRVAVAAGREQIGQHLLFDVHEAIDASETGGRADADRLFAALNDIDDPTVQLRIVRHDLRCGRPELASRRIDRWLDHGSARDFYPYASIAWRMTGDPRWQWLEGDERGVAVFDLGDELPPLDRLAATLRSIHTMKGAPLDQSVRGGTQTDGNLFHRIEPDIVALREVVRAAVARFVDRFPPHDSRHPLFGPARRPIDFAGSWSVRLTAGGRHSNHVHPQGWISSALYIVLPDDVGQAEAGWLSLGVPQAQLNLELPPTAMVEPKPGRLVLFPSTLWHGTRPFQDGERLTVAFDVAPPPTQTFD